MPITASMKARSAASLAASGFRSCSTGPCAVLAIGKRPDTELMYPESKLAQSRNAGVEKETPDAQEAYAKYSRPIEKPYQDGWIPD